MPASITRPLTVERTGHPGAPEPANVTPEEIGRILAESRLKGNVAEPTNYAGVLVRFPATLVERLGGTLEIESAPGRGTTVRAFVGQPAGVPHAEPGGLADATLSDHPVASAPGLLATGTVAPRDAPRP